tara:strand:+ start:6527 stop:6958 length:432 start_codon:yes stop_codon:yes gene_type:complete
MNFNIPNKQHLNEQEQEINDQIALLSSEQKRVFYEEKQQKWKDHDTYAVMAYLCFFSMYYLYLKQYKHFCFYAALQLVFYCSLVLSYQADWYFWQLLGMGFVPILLQALYHSMFSEQIVRAYNINMCKIILKHINSLKNKVSR